MDNQDVVVTLETSQRSITLSSNEFPLENVLYIIKHLLSGDTSVLDAPQLYEVVVYAEDGETVVKKFEIKIDSHAHAVDIAAEVAGVSLPKRGVSSFSKDGQTYYVEWKMPV